jgi:hypothetical protein
MSRGLFDDPLSGLFGAPTTSAATDVPTMLTAVTADGTNATGEDTPPPF